MPWPNLCWVGLRHKSGSLLIHNSFLSLALWEGVIIFVFGSLRLLVFLALQITNTKTEPMFSNFHLSSALRFDPDPLTTPPSACALVGLILGFWPLMRDGSRETLTWRGGASFQKGKEHYFTWITHSRTNFCSWKAYLGLLWMRQTRVEMSESTTPALLQEDRWPRCAQRADSHCCEGTVKPSTAHRVNTRGAIHSLAIKHARGNARSYTPTGAASTRERGARAPGPLREANISVMWWSLIEGVQCPMELLFY